MGCCCGCPGAACSECSGTPDKGLYVTSSGIVPVASGTCYFGATSSPLTTQISYSGSVQDYAACIAQDSGTPCHYANIPTPLKIITDIFNPGAQFRIGSIVGETCVQVATFETYVSAFTYAYLTLLAGVYTLTIVAAGNGLNGCVLFQGTATVASPPCKIATPILFTTNNVIPGNVYTYNVNGTTTTTGFGFASGGSAAVVFKKSCC